MECSGKGTRQLIARNAHVTPWADVLQQEDPDEEQLTETQCRWEWVDAAHLRAGRRVRSASFSVLALLVLVVLISVGAYRVGVEVSGIGAPAVGTVAVLVNAEGPALFAANCAGCHGAQAQGGAGPKLAGLSRAWSPAQFSHAVLDGQAPEGRALTTLMPRFRAAGFDGSVPTDAQLSAILGVLKGL
jgi:cytochrome c553